MADIAPWRLVIHIEERSPGRRATSGTWWLTLECGHFTARKMPAKNFANSVSLSWGNKKVAARYKPPRRVKCVSCWAGRVIRGSHEEEGA